ncbi:MAG: hypothetical protein PHN18_03065 [Sulfurospirillaceae bacterium]|nr:hypothetical protein [Sulfurospirillaceae bacterium]MDD2825613.1 hypothetical protein [Sulfurospirillaceae bacterium]
MARNLLLLIIGCLTPSLFGSEHFWFSYKVVTVNSVVVFEEKNISPIMVPNPAKTQFICTIALKEDKKFSTVELLKKHFDTLIPCFYSSKSHLISWDERSLKTSNDRIEMVIEPTYFTVEFKEEFATIRAIR